MYQNIIVEIKYEAEVNSMMILEEFIRKKEEIVIRNIVYSLYRSCLEINK